MNERINELIDAKIDATIVQMYIKMTTVLEKRYLLDPPIPPPPPPWLDLPQGPPRAPAGPPPGDSWVDIAAQAAFQRGMELLYLIKLIISIFLLLMRYRK